MRARPGGARVVAATDRLLVAALVLCAAVGCRASTEPQTVHRSDWKVLRVDRAPYDGVYALRERRAGGGRAAGEPLAERRVGKGEPLGFRRLPDGTVAAVAGAEEIRLGPGAHEWVMRADPGQVSGERTAGLAVTTVFIVGVIFAIGSALVFAGL